MIARSHAVQQAPKKPLPKKRQLCSVTLFVTEGNQRRLDDSAIGDQVAGKWRREERG